MQPIMQASLDPKLNDISHLPAYQSMRAVVVTIQGFQGITQIDRILPPLQAWIGTRL
jgi:hypothetical protein